MMSKAKLRNKTEEEWKDGSMGFMNSFTSKNVIFMLKEHG